MRFPLHSHHKVFNLYINLWMFSCFALPKFIFKAKLCVCLCLKLLIVCAYCWLFIYLSISRNWESACYVVNTGFLSICPLTVRTCSKSSSSWTLQKEAASRYNAQQCHTRTHTSHKMPLIQLLHLFPCEWNDHFSHLYVTAWVLQMFWM